MTDNSEFLAREVLGRIKTVEEVLSPLNDPLRINVLALLIYKFRSKSGYSDAYVEQAIRNAKEAVDEYEKFKKE